MNRLNTRNLQDSFRTSVGLPIKWRYGAIATGVLITQGIGRIWYSPKTFGAVSAKEFSASSHKTSVQEETANVLLETAVDTGFAFLLHYLSSKFFRPATPEQALICAALIGAVQMLPQLHEIIWGKRRIGSFLIDHLFSVMGVFVKFLCIQYIPY